MKISYFCDRCPNRSMLYRLYLRRKSANEKREFKAIDWYCEACKWFLTDEAFRRRPEVPNQKETLKQIRVTRREVREIVASFRQKWVIKI